MGGGSLQQGLWEDDSTGTVGLPDDSLLLQRSCSEIQEEADP